MLTKIERPDDEPRVETGPVQFGNDWPGIFIRGDNAMGFFARIVGAQRAGFLPSDGVGASALHDLLLMLKSCDARVLSDG
jgi:hypothetical protein